MLKRKGREDMKKKEKSAALFQEHVHAIRCPICNSPMKVVELKSLICLQNHSFDFAKQGYVNLLTRPVKSNYDKELFKARQSIITESDLYLPLHQKISDMILEHVDREEVIVFDAGCGEGSHLQKILKECRDEKMVGIGLDISKEGIRQAASQYEGISWIVGDLANSPIADQSCHYILNILSPANYKEFNRILVPDGFVIKVVPNSNYLKELREVLFDQPNKKSYTNDETVSLFSEQFKLIDVVNLKYTEELTKQQSTNLIEMTPLAWNVSKDDVEQIIERGIPEVTVDLDILIGRK